MIDLHCHMLSGLDDGSPDIETSILMAEGLSTLGYRAVCCTPHIPWGTDVHDRELLHEGREALSLRLHNAGISLALLPGAEHYSSIVPELIQDDRLVYYPRGDTFLMELPLRGFPPRLADLLFVAQVKNKRPVIAHVERYPEVQADIQALSSLRERGCLLLVNVSSLAGSWSRAAQGTARQLIKNGLIDAVSTDLHALEELESVKQGLAMLHELVGAERTNELTSKAPARIALANPDEFIVR
jgi:protein-tyrosine phosphatase